MAKNWRPETGKTREGLRSFAIPADDDDSSSSGEIYYAPGDAPTGKLPPFRVLRTITMGPFDLSLEKIPEDLSDLPKKRGRGRKNQSLDCNASNIAPQRNAKETLMEWKKSAAYRQCLQDPRDDELSQRESGFTESNESTITPENKKKEPPRAITAPKKQRRAPGKLDRRPKKLDYTENEQGETLESGFFSPISSRTTLSRFSKPSVSSGITEKVAGGKNTKSKKGLLKRDQGNKENDMSNIDREKSRFKGKNQHQQRNNVISREDWLISHKHDGRWIECSSKECSKWRFTFRYEDPTEVPDKWYCNMNDDPAFSSCDVPEEEIPEELAEELIELQFSVGSLVWARLDGFPWWPSIVDNCPDSGTYYQLDESSALPVKYHVRMLMKGPFSRAWIRNRDLKAFATNSRKDVVKRTKFRSIDYNPRLDVACAMANKAQALPIINRLEQYGCASKISKKKKKSKKVSKPSQKVVEQRATKRRRSLEPGKYKPGDLVWARAKLHPWWPAIIDRCPSTGDDYLNLESSEAPIEYYVTYINVDSFQVDFLDEKHLRLYTANPRDKLVKKTVFRKIDYRHQLDAACLLAKEARKMSSEQRLQRFGYAGVVSATVKPTRQIAKKAEISFCSISLSESLAEFDRLEQQERNGIFDTAIKPLSLASIPSPATMTENLPDLVKLSNPRLELNVSKKLVFVNSTLLSLQSMSKEGCAIDEPMDVSSSLNSSENLKLENVSDLFSSISDLSTMLSIDDIIASLPDQ